MNEWIKTSDKLPEELVPVLIKQAYTSEIMIAELHGKRWIEQCENMNIHGDCWADTEICIVDAPDYEKITHWMPLPEPPQC